MWLVVLTVPLRYAVSQSATEQVASTPSAGGVLPRLGPPSLRQTRAQPHSYLNAVQKLARHQLNATQRHHCQRLQPAHTAELANQMVAKTSQRHAPLPLPHAEAWAERPLPGIDGLGSSLTPHRTAATPTRWVPRSSTVRSKRVGLPCPNVRAACSDRELAVGLTVAALM